MRERVSMSNATKHLLVLAVVAGAFVLYSAPVFAQAASSAGKLDHLLCYDVNDKLKVDATVNLRTELQPEFSQARCRVIKPTKFCVPATKIVTQAGTVGPPIVGQSLRDDYICYLVKCPKNIFPEIPDKLVADQFGQRKQERFKPVELCVPARKGAPPCGRIGSGRQCGGVCPDDSTGQATACRFDPVLEECTCEPQPCGPKRDGSGHCGGECPDPSQTCLPGFDASGKKACVCQEPPPPPCGLNTATGTCGGSCPNPADQCISTAAGIDCICQPPEEGCKRDAASGQCGGPCPTGLTCVLNPAINDCRCESPPRQCGPNPLTGQCGGDCPAGSECRFVSPPGTPPACGCVTP